ncbi:MULTISPECIES: fimbria/pilus chaperone family protein [Yersinia]|uniref:fimbria/pilus chaperone family protein n=1 Tax=Yersinia TaxID=629 RepID=UPI0005DB1A84|nr:MULTISPECIES: fimbria/pilus chaperone family protein [Yersinia]CQJ67418.1 putative periplasmic chaperone protein [Yersinia intermedia]
MTFLSRGLFLVALFNGIPPLALAAGMVPETPLVFILAADGGGTVNVSNTDAGPALLYTTVQNLPDDKSGVTVIPTQPIIRVEGGKIQQVRFVLEGAAAIQVQQLKRVVFEGIPERKPGANQMVMTVRQDLPLIIHPPGVPNVNDPWTRLAWAVKNGALTVNNPSPYVVRLDPKVVLLPSNTPGTLAKTYLLPGQSLAVTLVAGTVPADDREIKLFPASRYGFQAQDYRAALTR